MSYVDAALAPQRKTGQIKLHNAAAFEGMRKAGRLAAQAAEIHDELQKQARLLLQEVELPRSAEAVVLQRSRLAKASRQSIREMLRHVWAREGWPLSRMSHKCWERAAALAAGEETAIDLPGGVTMTCRGQVIQLRRKTH